MSSSSALIGTMPANTHDKLIVQGFYRIAFEHLGPPTPNAKPFPPLIPVKDQSPTRPHDSQQWQVYAQASSVMAVIVLVTATRLLLRGYKKELRWGADDWAIIVGAACAVAFCGTRISSARGGGAGKHMYDASYAEFENFLAIQASFGYIFYVFAIGFVKISICLFNRRLTGLISRRWMYYHYTLLILILCFIVTFALSQPLQCRPQLASFRLSELGARDYNTVCVNGTNLNAAFSITHLLLDAFILPVPLIIMKRLQLTVWQQARLVFLFGVGLLSVLGAVMTIKVMYSKQEDMMYNFPKFNRWMMIDLVFAISVASLPTLNALLPRSWRKGASIVRQDDRAPYYGSSSEPSSGGRTQRFFSRSFGSRAPGTTANESNASSRIHVQTAVEVEQRGTAERHADGVWREKTGAGWAESSSTGSSSSSSSTRGEYEHENEHQHKHDNEDQAAWEHKAEGASVQEVVVSGESSSDEHRGEKSTGDVS